MNKSTCRYWHRDCFISEIEYIIGKVEDALATKDDIISVFGEDAFGFTLYRCFRRFMISSVVSAANRLHQLIGSTKLFGDFCIFQALLMESVDFFIKEFLL